MLKKADKLDRDLFKGFTKPLKSFTGGVFLLRIFSIPKSNRPKFAVSISKKQEKKAVLRNKIRRLAYKAIKESINLGKPGFAYHFILREKPKDVKNDINRDIPHLLKGAEKI